MVVQVSPELGAVVEALAANLALELVRLKKLGLRDQVAPTDGISGGLLTESGFRGLRRTEACWRVTRFSSSRFALSASEVND